MTSSTVVRVELGPRSYDIEVAAGSLSRAGAFLLERCHASHAVVVTDKNVVDPHGIVVIDSLHSAGMRTDLVALDPGEEMKSVEAAQTLWDALATIKADRSTIIVAVGGGVIGDLAGFVAATYTRGLRFLQVPTTLLAMVDSSVGGKVGINLRAGKNLVGCFWQPQGVVIDSNALVTLPEREFRSGLAEVVKYGVILDAEFFEFLETNRRLILDRDAATLTHVIGRCCRLKADVVEQDEREETGLRAVLNYGHTFGHAIEKVAAYGTWLHGEAVSIGMMCAARMAASLGRVDGRFSARQQELLESFGLPVTSPDLDRNKLLSAMFLDKKSKDGQLNFVLPDELGHVEVVSGVSPDAALAAFK